MKGANTKQDDYIEHLLTASTHNTMLFFTNTGKCYWLKVHQIPQTSRTSQGRAIVNLIGCDPEEKIQAFVSVKDFKEEDSIVMSTKKGLIKRSNMMLYSKPRKGGIFAIDINEGDELIQAKTIQENQDIILATNKGKAIRFEEPQIKFNLLDGKVLIRALSPNKNILISNFPARSAAVTGSNLP